MKTKITVNMDGALFQGKPCDVTSVSRGWIGIIDSTGRAKKVRATEVTTEVAAATIAAGDAVADAAEVTKPEILIPGINVQTRSNTMATTVKRGRRARTTSPKANGNGAAQRKLGDSEFRNFEKYERHETASGNISFDNGDAVSTKLRGLDIGGIYDVAAAKLGVSVRSLKDKYSHLNIGMQRMNLANRIRGAAKAKDKAA